MLVKVTTTQTTSSQSLSTWVTNSSTNFQNSESVLGWKIAQENNNTANSNVALEGVATMRVGTTPGGNGVASYTMNTSGGTSNINVGIGAMYWEEQIRWWSLDSNRCLMDCLAAKETQAPHPTDTLTKDEFTSFVGNK